MSEWFIQHDEETEIGPLLPSELLDLIRKGVVIEDTLCRKNDSPWFRAAEVGGLFRAAAGTVGYVCPNCNRSVSEPPTYCKGCERYIDEATPIFRDANGRKVFADGRDFSVPKENFASWATWLNRIHEQRDSRTYASDEEDDSKKIE